MIVRLIVLMLLVGLLGACSMEQTREKEKKLQHAALYNMQAGAQYMRNGNLPMAKEKLDKSLMQDPDSAKAHEMYAILQQRLGQPEKAEKHYRRALSLNPEDSRTHNNYGTFLCSERRIDEAEEQFLLAVKDPLYPTPWAAYTNAGLCLIQGSDQIKAEQYFRNALALNPEFLDALVEMARLTFDQGNYLSARAYVQRYHLVRAKRVKDDPSMKPSTPEMLWICVRTEKYLKDEQESDRCARQLVRFYPKAKETELFLESRGYDRR